MTTSRPVHSFNGGPDADDLRRWVREGLTNREIGELVGRLENTEPATKQTVAYWLDKHGIKRPSRNTIPGGHSDYRPWRVLPQHDGDGIQHRLYEFSRRQQGVPLDDYENRRLDAFLELLKELDVVVDYNPDLEYGWVLRRREYFDDPDNIIRHPDRSGVRA